MSLFSSWRTFFFLICVFFFAHHDIKFLEREGDFGHFRSADEIAEAIARGSVPRQIALLSLGFFGLMNSVIGTRRKIGVQGLLGWLLIFYLLWAISSFLWSDNPLLTLKRTFVLLLFFLGAVGFSKEMNSLEIFKLAFLGCSFFLFLGIAVEIQLGVFNPFSQDYRFMGTLAPNHQGWNCAFVIFSSLALAKISGNRKGIFLSVGTVGFVFLVLTKSRSAFGGALMAVFISWILFSSKAKRAAIIYSLIFLVSFTFLVGGDFYSSLMRGGVLLGRDDPDNVQELSGRLPLWRECLRYIDDRFYLGYGYNSFWTAKHILEIDDAIGWPAPGAHNGYLDHILSLGVVGGVVYTGILVLGLVRSRKFRLSENRIEGSFFFVILLFYILVMFMEEIANVVCLPSFIVLVILVNFGFFRSCDSGTCVP